MFEWDEAKKRANRVKHGFEEAQAVFDDSHARVFLDSAHSAAEDRFVIIGMSATARLLVVVHCFREADSIIRIISARKATRKEARTCEEGI
jgi:uncharacterized DUF497 family protein